jgi:hypothetical protein
MTSAELRDIIVSSEFRQDLGELSSYLASTKQERPIVYCLAKQLWKRRVKFQLEAKLKDLVVNERRFEFKFSYDCDMERLEHELKKHGDKSLEEMWSDAHSGRGLSRSWSMMPLIYGDICVKKPDVFVWIICSRDLSNVNPADRKRICWSIEQCKWNARHPYSGSDRTYLKVADSFLHELHLVRPFSMLNEEISTTGDFPSTYHFRICEFSKST